MIGGTMIKNYQTIVEIIKQYPDLSRFLPSCCPAKIFQHSLLQRRQHLKKIVVHSVLLKVVHSVLLKVVHCTTFGLTQGLYYTIC